MGRPLTLGRRCQLEEVGTCPACLLGATAFGAHPRIPVGWLCVVVPLGEVSEVYVDRRTLLWRVQLRAVVVTSPRPPRAAVVNFTTQLGQPYHLPSTGQRTSPTFKEALSVAMRVWHRAAICESCTPRRNRTCFPSEESLPQGVMKRPAALVLQLWLNTPKISSLILCPLASGPRVRLRFFIANQNARYSVSVL